MERKSVNLQRLYWKTDKERLLQIMQHLNPKYLVGLYEKMGGISDDGCPNYGDDEEKEPNMVTVKYDGCIFTASRKQLRKELVRRGLITQNDFTNFVYSDGSTKKWGVKNYKIDVKVEMPNGWTHFEKELKSGKELRDIEHETKLKKV